MAFAAGDLERELCRIPDVFAARVTINGSGRATEARILATPERAAKRVRRDVQSVALASFGIELAPSAISITQLERAPARDDQEPTAPASEREAVNDEGGSEAGLDFDEEEEPATVQLDDQVLTGTEATGPVRDEGGVAREAPSSEVAEEVVVEEVEVAHDAAPVELVHVSVTVTDTRIATSVELARGDAVASGKAEGAASEAISARAVAESVLAALSELGALDVDMGVDHAAVLPMGALRVAVVVATLSAPGVDQRVTSGSCVVTGSGEHHALARAALVAAIGAAS
jgi:hypothetical protein